MPLDGNVVEHEIAALTLLRAGRERVAAGWCQRISSTSDGRVCAIGALLFWDSPPDFDVALAALHRAAGLRRGEFVERWNDTAGRTQAEVVAAYDRAIALMEGK